MADAFDYIIVGAGSAGCVLANKLSAQPGCRVLLIEAGGEDRHPMIPIPIGIGKTLYDPSLCWYYPTEAEPGNAGEPRMFMRGRVLGGSSSVNGMVYCRGQPEDYDGWRDLGCTGWGWADMAPVFRALEDHELGDDGVRGVGGPLHVSVRKDRTPLTEALIDAANAMGTRRREDVNRPDQEGIGYCPVTIRNGRRVSAADAFLKPVRHRPNLTVVTDTLIDRLMFDGLRVVGVVGRAKGAPVEYRARGEVIVSSGTLQSPKLLMLSGIGPAEDLKACGITPLVDSPWVGRNLLEHKTISQQIRLSRDFSLNGKLRGWRAGLSMLRYLLRHDGPMAATYDINAFIKTRPELAQPDAQILFWAMTIDRDYQAGVRPEAQPGLLAMGYPLRTSSAGSVRLTGPGPDAPLSVSTNFLSTNHDCDVMVGIFHYMRRLFAQPALAPFVAFESFPGPDVKSDEDILDASRRDLTCQHAVGTCRMGRAGEAVLDERARVRGVEGLRVVDLSAMPTQVSGNTNGPAMALAWRAAELIAADS
ncbi:glucose-methanol-choline oxidoreductase [Sphingobium sp. MI1205]|nr:glucose-methanol-choline oxidoreductase [Sphingobium sp. MI1205]